MTSWGSPGWLWGVALLPVVAIGLWIAERARVRLLARFATPEMHRTLGIVIGSGSRALRSVLLIASLACVLVGLARPRGNPRTLETTGLGRDLTFVLDVSRSMLATDVAPNRLERAKLWIRDVAASLHGDRVGLVAFAGTAVVKCPLTTDYTFFKLALDDLTPQSVSRGGTMIGDAIRRSLDDVFDQEQGRPRDMILITDGDDQESFPVQAGELAGQRGVRIITIGVGDAAGGAVVPGATGELRYKGERVITRQDPTTLASIASASADGVFFNVGTGTIELDRVYEDLSRGRERVKTEVQSTISYDEYFQPLLATAVLLLAVDFIADRRGRRVL